MRSVWVSVRQSQHALTRRAFTVLCDLVEHAGQLVTRDDLFESVWETPLKAQS